VLAAADQVLVDPATHERVHADLETHQIHTLRLRGKKDPIVVWEVRETTKASELLATDA
jgi:class 3 adenylate cyclase